MKWSEAFGIRKGDVVSLVGAGGKTTLLVLLADELAGLGWRVIATTTTRIGSSQLTSFRTSLAFKGDPSQVQKSLETSPLFVYSDRDDEKVYGLTPDQLAIVQPLADVLLIEADGARRLPFKMPRLDEPVIARFTTIVVPIVSLNVLGEPLDDEHIFNAVGISAQVGFPYGAVMKSRWIADVLVHPLGGLKAVPADARVIPYLNDVPQTGHIRGRGRFIAMQLLKNLRVERVVMGDTHTSQHITAVERRIGAVVLAAGLSSRMGVMKPLLEWTQGESILDHILRVLKSACVDYIVVVTGYQSEQVEQIVRKHGAYPVYNADFAAGEMLSSVKAGLWAMPEQIAGAMIVLGDQPTIRTTVVKQVMRMYRQGTGQIVAPSYQMRRGHPIMIDRHLWDELYGLPNGSAPRDVINQHPDVTVYVNVDDEGVLRDVDTPQQYQDERRRAGLPPI